MLYLSLKMLLSAAMVLIVTLVAERGSPRFAGVLLGFPLGAGLSLAFLAIEQGPIFAADSARWTMQGIIATLGFLFDPAATCLNASGDTIASMLVTRLVEGKEWLAKAAAAKKSRV